MNGEGREGREGRGLKEGEKLKIRGKLQETTIYRLKNGNMKGEGSGEERCSPIRIYPLFRDVQFRKDEKDVEGGVMILMTDREDAIKMTPEEAFMVGRQLIEHAKERGYVEE